MRVEPMFWGRMPTWEARSFLRTARRRDELWAAVANASRGGFETLFPEGSAALLDAAEETFLSGAAPDQVLQVALSSYFERFPADPDDEFFDPSAQVLMLWIRSTTAVAASCGPHLLRLEWANGTVTAWPPDSARFMLSEPRVWRSADPARPADTSWWHGPRPTAVELRDVRSADALGDAPIPESLASVTTEAPILAVLRCA